MDGPDFIIVGAMKCGTTALATYLQSHREIFFTRHKEPGYFATDFPSIQYVTKESEYRRLFHTRKHTARIAGEGTVWYLYSDEALQNIRRFNPAAKIIIMLRNPIDMLISLHEHNKLFFSETTDTLEDAWRVQSERLAGHCTAKNPVNPRMYQYEQIGMLGRQVQRAMNIFPREQIHVIIFDDFVSNTKAVYEGVLAFLGVAPDGRVKFPQTNPLREYRNPKLTWPLFKTIRLFSQLRVKLGILTNTRILSYLTPFLTIPVQKQRRNLSEAFREEMIDTFRDDIHLLSDLLQRDMSHWLLPISNHTSPTETAMP